MTETIAEPNFQRITEHLRSNAVRYFPDLKGKPVDVRLEGGGARVFSSVYRFNLGTGAREHDVIVKLPGPRTSMASGEAGADRPRLKPLFDPDAKLRSEYETLSAIERHFGALGDPRFGAVRVLDFLPDAHAIVMERAAETSLKTLLARSNRVQRPFLRIDVEGRLRNAGAWLRAYHALPPLAHTGERSGTRADLIAMIERFGDYLARTHQDREYFERVAARACVAARAALPERLKTAMSHGDFAPRNILVGPGDRVTVFDTLGGWRAPIYEDLGLFLSALHTNKAQAYTWGLAFGTQLLRRFERVLLEGYFAPDEPPRAAINLFTVQALLDKWASRDDVGHPAGAGYGLVATKHCIRRHVDRLLDEVENA